MVGDQRRSRFLSRLPIDPLAYDLPAVERTASRLPHAEGFACRACECADTCTSGAHPSEEEVHTVRGESPVGSLRSSAPSGTSRGRLTGVQKTTRLVATLASSALLTLGVTGMSVAEAADPVAHGATVVGALPAPPSGPGPGLLAVWQPGTGAVRQVRFASAHSTAGSSFYVAADQATHSVFVPTEAGITEVVSERSWQLIGSFDSPVGSRVAKITANGRLLVVESAGQTAAYETTAPYQHVFTASLGGNALVVTPSGKQAFVGGNADSVVTELALPSGRVVRTFPVRHSGDMVWAGGQVFSADIASGVMSVIHPGSGRVTEIATPEVDPTFSYSDIGAATAGFMQLAVGPGQRRLYAAGFSGHILAFSVRRDTYLGEVKIAVDPTGANQLSGLAVLPGGRLAAVTVENLARSVVVSLQTGQILSSQAALASNRWVAVNQS